MKKIFNTYTGSPFLNNALQTIEVLAGLDNVSEITTDTLLELYKKYKPSRLFKRMKSYSMLFTRNGPLFNDKDFGEKIYKGIFEYTLNNLETTGSNQCEVSGLRFDTSFSKIYENVLYDIKYPVKKISGKDKTINRCWFPLTGALGSDAQALPQAKFDIQIHPICLVIIQFLPFSAVLYKGGVLLIDSTNFEFTKDFIEESVTRVREQMETTSSNKSIENIKDFSQGDYIHRAIQIYKELRGDYDTYTDLNLWCYSNSGTGASCEIDRLPNRTFKTLLKIYNTSFQCREDLKDILKRSAKQFLEYLIEGKDYYGLYPRKITIKKGKKTETVKLEGVSVEFFDVYQAAIDNDKYKTYAKYIAFLVNEDKELKQSEIKLLEKFDAYKEPEYNTLIYTVLLRAAQKDLWSLENHLEILDKTDDDIIRSWIYGVFKMVHFYYHKKGFLEDCPVAKETKLTPILSTVIYLIEQDKRKVDTLKVLGDDQNYKSFNINNIFIRNPEQVELGAITNYFYEDYSPRKKDLNKLLRLYYNQPNPSFEFQESYVDCFKNRETQPFLIYQQFVNVFQIYYLDKYNNDFSKYERSVLKSFPKENNRFKAWAIDVLAKMKDYSNEEIIDRSQIEQFEEELFYAPNGVYSLSFSRFALHFLLQQNYLKTFSNKEIEIV